MFVLRNNKLIIGLVLLGVIVSFFFIPGLKVRHNLKNFFVENDPDLDFYNDFRKSFSSDENTLLIAIKSHSGIYKYEFLEEINDFTIKCERLPHVFKATSITTIKDIIKSPSGFTRFPYLHFRDSLRYKSDSTRISKAPQLNSLLISKDKKSVVVILEIEDRIDASDKDQLIIELDKLIENYSFDEVHFAGTLNYETRYYRLIGKEIQINILLCSIVIVVILILIFRSLAGVLLPVSAVIIALIFLYGYLGAFNKPLNVLSTLFPTILMVVGISNLVHILSKYRDLRSKGVDKKNALVDTLKELRVTIFLTSFTTAVGFFSLSVSTIKLFRNFGIDSGIGILIAYVVAITFVPAVLINLKGEFLTNRKKSSYSSLNRILNYVFVLVTRFPNRIVGVSLIVLIVSFFGISQIDTNNFILSNFKGSSPIKKDFHFFEENFLGVRNYEIAIDLKEGELIKNTSILRDIDKLHSYLEKDPAYTAVYSPASIFKSMNMLYNGGNSLAFQLPVSQLVINKYDKEASRINRKMYSQFIDSTRTRGRITIRMKDIGSNKVKQLNEEMINWVKSNSDTVKIQFRATGAMLLADKSNDYLVRNMLLSLALAFFIVSIIMFFLFMDLRMVIISLIPNIFPLLIVSAIIGFTGITFNGSIAIIFTIGFVIAVDDTIHFLSKFKLEYKKSLDVKSAIKTTLTETGKAIVITSIILFFGFIVLLHSEMKGVFYQGLLVAITVVTALIADLFLLPVLLVYLIKKKGN